MNVAIDITPLYTGHKDRGVGTYTKLLIDALGKYEKEHSYHFFVRGQKVPDSVELIHYPYFDPFFVTLPPFYSKPTIITVHDLIPLVFPKHFPSGLRGALKWQYQRLRLGSARRIIADSECSRRDTQRIAGISGTHIDVVRLAPSSQFKPVTNESLLWVTKTKYRLPDSFILYVGDVNWNKNVLGMIRAFQQVRTKAKLVLVGKAFFENSNEARKIASYLHNEDLGGDVIRVGGIPIKDLVAIYNLASVYIQPSFYEGFGLPILEAMACGVPVVSSRAASLAEIAGPAITIDPEDPKDITRGLHQALTLSLKRRHALITAQREWVGQYSWERVAHATIQSYEKSLA